MKSPFLQNYKHGFTLVETLVAISILLVVIIGPMTIAQKGIQNAYFARDQLTAVFLAQEGIEAVRELRDDAALNIFDKLVHDDLSGADHTWDWFGQPLTNKCFDSNTETGGCAFDPSDRSFFNCIDRVTGCRLFITPSGQYTYDAGEPESIYTRKIYIEEDGSGFATKVRVEVTWNAVAFGGAEKKVELETWLYDRYKHYESD